MDARFNDLANNLVGGISVAPAIQSATIASGAGTAVDLVSGEGMCFALAQVGAIVGTPSFAVQVEQSDTSGGAYTDVPVGGAVTLAAANTAAIINFRRTKRFVKVRAVLTGTTSLAFGVAVYSTKKAT